MQLEFFPEYDKREVLYVAGMFSPSVVSRSVNWNVAIAQQVSYKLTMAGYTTFTPHLNFGWLAMEQYQPSWEQILEHCLKVLERCDRLVLCPLWNHSTGAQREKEHADKHDIPSIEFCWSDLFKDNPS